jgi:nucleolar protein 58
MVATKTALSARVDALTVTDETEVKSEPSAPTIGLENRAKLEARLRVLEAEMDATGVRRFASGPNQQQRVKPGPAVPTYNTAADAVGLVSTQREPMETAVKAALDVKEEKRRAKEERRAKRRSEKTKVEEPDEGEADAMEVDAEEKDEKKRKRRKSDVVPTIADDAVPMVRGCRSSCSPFLLTSGPQEDVETEAERKARKQAKKAEKAAKKAVKKEK